jgi:uncharacterized protein (TIGR02996 family)
MSQALLQAIIDHPDDDDARLVFADWLDEHGQPERAEFIRVQIAMGHPRENVDRWLDLEMRENELLERHQREWLDAFPGRVLSGTFCRGFLTDATVDVPTYLEYVENIRRLSPVQRFYLDLNEVTTSPSMLELLPVSFLRDYSVLPVGIRRDMLVIATAPYADGDLLQMLQFVLNRSVELVEASAEQVAEAIDWRCGVVGAVSQPVDTVCFEEVAIDFGEDPIPLASARNNQSPIAKLVDMMLGEAVRARVSRIRIEPTADRIVVWYRFSDDFVERDHPPRRLLYPLAARIRFLAGTNMGSSQGHFPFGDGWHAFVDMIQGPFGPIAELSLRQTARPPSRTPPKP